MELYLSEKQIGKLAKTIKEDESSSDSSSSEAKPKSGTSSNQSGGKGYPEVSKWESGVTRGAGNQVGVTKWADVVGSKLIRSKANQLHEQDAPPINFDNLEFSEKLKEDEKINFDDNFLIAKIPLENRLKLKTIIIPKKGQQSFWLPGEDRVANFFKSWENTTNQNKIPENKDFDYLFPDGTLKNFTIDDKFFISRCLFKEGKWTFDWFVDYNTRTPYTQEEYIKNVKIPNEYIKDWYDKWGRNTLMVGSLLAFIILPGWGGIITAGIIDLGVASIDISRGDYLGGTISLIAAFLPAFSEVMGWGKVTISEAKAISEYVKDVKTYDELIEMFTNELSPKFIKNKQHRYLLRKLVSEEPDKIAKTIDKIVMGGFELASRDKNKMLELMLNLNFMLKNKIIPKQSAVNIFKTLGAREFGYFLGAYGVIYLGVEGGSWAYGVIKNRHFDKKIQEKFEEITNKPELINSFGNNPEFELGPKFTKIFNMGLTKQFDEKLNPVLAIYQVKYENTNIDYYVKISIYLLDRFIENQNQDFKKLAADFELKNK